MSLFNFKALGLAVLALSLAACAPSGGTGTATKDGETDHLLEASIDQISLSGPQYAMVSVAAQFSLNASGTSTVNTATWDFGDGSTVVSGVGPQSHTYYQTGVLAVTVTGTDSNGTSLTFSQTITIVPYSETDICISSLAMSVPDQATAGQAITGVVSVPLCLSTSVASVTWNFGDGGTATGTTVNYTYTANGTYNIAATVTVTGVSTPFILTGTVIVTGAATPTPTPSASSSPAPTPTPTPAPSVTPTPAPSHSPTPTPSPSVSSTPAPTPSPTPTGSSPHGNYCDCRHHYNWDFELSNNFSSTPLIECAHDLVRDWGHDCKIWFDDHEDWYNAQSAWTRTCQTGLGAGQSSDDQNSCHNNGHDGWDNDCDNWRYPPNPGNTTSFGGSCDGSTTAKSGAHEFFYNLTPIPDASAYAAPTGKYANQHLAGSMDLFNAQGVIASSSLAVCTTEINVPMQPWSNGFPNYPSLQEWFGVCYDGSWIAPTAGLYTFVTAVDDAIAIWIDGNLVGENDDGNVSSTVVAKNTGEPYSPDPVAFAPVMLAAGVHTVKITYYQAWPVVLGEQVWVFNPGQTYTKGSTPPDSAFMQLSEPIDGVLNCPY